MKPEDKKFILVCHASNKKGVFVSKDIYQYEPYEIYVEIIQLCTGKRGVTKRKITKGIQSIRMYVKKHGEKPIDSIGV